MKNIELEGKFVYLDQLIDKTLRLINKVEPNTDGRLEYYKCELVVPLNMDMSLFVQELTDWGMWNLNLSPSKESFFVSGIIILNLQYEPETRSVFITFTFPKEYQESKTEFSNRFLNAKFKNSTSWISRVESYHKRVLGLCEESESYYDSPEVNADLPNAMDYFNELLKG